MSKTMLVPVKGADNITVPIAKLITLHGFRFAIHRPIGVGTQVGWSVSEYTTGGLICSGRGGLYNRLNTIRDAEVAIAGRFGESDVARLTKLMASWKKLNA